MIQFALFQGGSGGKGVWGAPPEVYDLEDPSYEDEDAQEVMWS